MRQTTVLVMLLVLIFGGWLYAQEIEKPIEKEEKITPELQAKIEELINKSGDDNWYIREEATQELIKIGKLALDLVKNAKQDKDPERAMRAKYIHGQILINIQEQHLEIFIVTDKKSYPEKEPFIIKCRIINKGDEPILIHLPHALSRPDGPMMNKINTLAKEGETIIPFNTFPFNYDLGHVYFHNFKLITKKQDVVIPLKFFALPGRYRIKFVYDFKRLGLDNLIVEETDPAKRLNIIKQWYKCQEIQKESNELEIEITQNR